MQEYRFFKARFKERVQWSITGKCNYCCKHCFLSAPEVVQGEPTWDELLRSIGRL
jgi:MoaA/NifB/PqqE/SkfB family radical SAM enzyme